MKIKKRLHPTFYFFLLSTALVASAVVLEFVASELNDVKAESQILPFVESQADSVLRLSIATNEIAYNTRDRMIYATRPSSAGEGGNSLTRIDPLTGEVGASVFVGSEPNKVVIADDGQTIYVSLDGSYSIRRYDALTQTPGIVFSVGRNTSGAFGIGTPFLARDIALAPGDPDRLAVSRQMPGISPGGEGTVIFDNGVPLPLIGPGHSETPAYLAFSSSASVLYGGTYDAGLRTLSVSSNGVTDTGARTSFSPLKIVYEDGRIFDTKGHVIDADTRTLLGTCVGVVHQPNYLSNTAFVPDTATGRVLYAVKTGNSIIIKAFDLNTFLEIGTMTVPNTGSDNFPTALIRYGTNGLAMRTTDNDLFLIQTALLPTANPLPIPTTTPAAPTPTPTPHLKFIRQLELRNRDLLYQPADRKFYASVPNTAGDPHANSLVRIEPSTAAIESSFQLGNNPGRLAFSEDAQILYAGIDGENAVKKFDMRTQTAVSQFPLGVGLNGAKTAYDIEILPNDSNAVAVSYGSSGYNYDGVDIYDNGVKRAQKADRAGEITVVSPQSLLIGETYMSKHTISPRDSRWRRNLRSAASEHPSLSATGSTPPAATWSI